jgi:hypothetical protein
LREALHRNARRFDLGLILGRSCGKLLELQFQLIDEPLAALGARAEHLALHLRDYQLQMLDQRLGTGELGARLQQRRLEWPLRRRGVGPMPPPCDIRIIK